MGGLVGLVSTLGNRLTQFAWIKEKSRHIQAAFLARKMGVPGAPISGILNKTLSGG